MAATDAPTSMLFDDGLGDLGPLSELRASFEQRTGGRTLLERARAHGLADRVAVPATIAPLLTPRLECPVNASAARALLVNGRLHAPLHEALLAEITELEPATALMTQDGSVVAAHLTGAACDGFLAQIAAGTAPALPPECRIQRVSAPLWRRPWDLLEAGRLGALLSADIESVAGGWSTSERQPLPANCAQVGSGPLHLHASASLGVGVVFDTTEGGVLVGAGAQVRHGAVVTGPAFIGAKCIVGDHAVLKARTALGPQCRASGEIGSVIFQGCSNKAHDGHLGDALVGEWVNLGASTVNSNLLNTYGEVAMRLRPGASLERTGRQFMGCILGDHAKTAIGTRIMTGSSIGTGVMWAATAPISGAVGAFVWATDEGRRLYRVEKFLEVARTVMARRSVTPSPAYEARLAMLATAAAAGTVAPAGFAAASPARAPKPPAA